MFLQLDPYFREFRLHSIMSEHKKTITSICWHPHDPDILSSSGADLKIFVWRVSQQRIVASLSGGMIKEAPMCIGWSFSDDTCLAFVSGKGPLMLWHYTETRCPDIVRDSQNLSSDVALFRWHPKKQGTVAFGHTDGSITVSSIGEQLFISVP